MILESIGNKFFKLIAKVNPACFSNIVYTPFHEAYRK